MKRAHAVALCKERGMALVDLAVTADEEEWRRLQSELDGAGVTTLLRNGRGDLCEANPLAKGCF